MHPILYEQEAFRRFHQKPIAELEFFVQQHYRSAEIHFFPGGEICFFTGVWAGAHQLKIWTGVFEGPNESCNVVLPQSGFNFPGQAR